MAKGPDRPQGGSKPRPWLGARARSESRDPDAEVRGEGSDARDRDGGAKSARPAHRDADSAGQRPRGVSPRGDARPSHGGGASSKSNWKPPAERTGTSNTGGGGSSRGSGPQRERGRDEQQFRGRGHGDARGDARGDGDTGVYAREGQLTRPEDKLVRIAGLPSVIELFATDAPSVERLYFEARFKGDVAEFCEILGRRRKVYRQLGDDEMRRVAGTVMHGGVVALARPRQIRDLDLAEAERWAKAGEPILVLDGIGNPQNVGAIARTAAFFGVKRLVLSDHPAQAGLSDAAHRIAKGGLQRLEIYRAPGLAHTLRRLKAFFEVVGTAIEGTKDLDGVRGAGRPIALVLGNEEDGLSPHTLDACSSIVALHGVGHVQSLNVGAAAAILIHSLLVPRR